MNRFVGLEQYATWEICGITRGIIDPKTKIKTPKSTAKTWICEHLDEAVPNKEFFTEKVFNQQVLERIEKYIQPIFNYNSSSEDGFDIDDVMEQDED